MFKRFASITAAAAITVGGALLATPAQATIPRPVPTPQTSVQRTINLRAGEACSFPVRIRVRIDDLSRDRRRNALVITADGVRGRVTNLRNGETFRFRGDTEYRIRRNGIIRGDGAQLLLLDRGLNRRRGVNRLVFTEDPTRGQLLGGRVPVLPRERLIRAGDLVNVCAEIRGVRPRPRI